MSELLEVWKRATRPGRTCQGFFLWNDKARSLCLPGDYFICVTAAKATEEDEPNNGKKKQKPAKIGDKSDVKVSASAVVPGQKKKSKPAGKGKKPRKAEGDVAAGDDDVEGGGKCSKEI